MGFKPAYKSTMSDERRKELAKEVGAAVKAGGYEFGKKDDRSEDASCRERV